jgi:hypothetical protein
MPLASTTFFAPVERAASMSACIPMDWKPRFFFFSSSERNAD